MMDENFDRHYQAGRADLNAALSNGLSRFGEAVSNAFNVLNRIEYSAPWALRNNRAKCN
jgi:hypothetical protein